MKASGGTVCRFYGTPGGCWYGDNCRFIHDYNQNNSSEQGREPIDVRRCKFYSTPSGCRFGNNCCFLHASLVPDNSEEKYEQETPEKLEWNPQCDSDTSGTGTFYSAEGGADYGDANWREPDLVYPDSTDENDEDYDADGDGVGEGEDSSLWSEDSEKRKKKWETMKSEKKDRTKPEIKEAVCGECGAEFKSDDAFELLRAHYLEQFKKFNYKHLAFLGKHYRFDHTTCCMICDKLFGRSRDLLRHIVDKSKQETEDGEEHHVFIDVGVVLPFCYRDTVDHDDDKLLEELFLSLVHTYTGSDTDTEDEDFLNFMSLAHMLTKMPHAHILNMGAEESSGDDSDIGGVFGFSEDDCFELACQGIKPWDPEAGAALAVLNGYYDDF